MMDILRKHNLAAMFTIVTVLLVGTGFFLFRTDANRVMVTGNHWTHEQQIELFQIVYTGEWENGVPSDAYDRNCYSRLHHMQSHRIGEQTFTTPIFHTWCDYRVNRWRYSRSLWTRGDSLRDELTWPERDFQHCETAEIGCQRFAAQIPTYIADLQNGDHTYNCAVTLDMWQRMNIESWWVADVSTAIDHLWCHTLRGEA